MSDSPNHPSRPCADHVLLAPEGDRTEPWCAICGWPDTHDQPAATITGILHPRVEPHPVIRSFDLYSYGPSLTGLGGPITVQPVSGATVGRCPLSPSTYHLPGQGCFACGRAT